MGGGATGQGWRDTWQGWRGYRAEGAGNIGQGSG